MSSPRDFIKTMLRYAFGIQRKTQRQREDRLLQDKGADPRQGLLPHSQFQISHFVQRRQ